MTKEEFKNLNRLVIDTAKNSWRSLIYKYFYENGGENEVIEFNDVTTMGYKVNEYIVYPKKLFRNEKHMISMLRYVENEYLLTCEEDEVIEIIQLSLDELGGFVSFIEENLK